MQKLLAAATIKCRGQTIPKFYVEINAIKAHIALYQTNDTHSHNTISIINYVHNKIEEKCILFG